MPYMLLSSDLFIQCLFTRREKVGLMIRGISMIFIETGDAIGVGELKVFAWCFICHTLQEYIFYAEERLA